jgi:NAD+ synthase (glutamine-hydrolysing)
MKLRVSGIQMEVTRDVERNVAALSRAIQEASSAGAEILLTPEGALSGYTPEFDPDAVEKALSQVTALAKAHHLGLALGTCFREHDNLTYNQLRFYAPDGEYLGFHSKILRCGSLGDPPEGEIVDYATTELKVLSFGGLTVGGLICNDMWANPGCTPGSDPYLSRLLAGMGARVIFHAVNGGRDDSPWSREVVWNFHESNLRMRAAAAGVWIVTVDNCAPVHLPCSAPSGVLNPQGEWVCRAEKQGERLFVHTVEW